jgi:transposase
MQADVVAAIRAVQADVLFLPPYSPEYNPNEIAWSKLRRIHPRLPTLTRETLDQAVAHAMSYVSVADISAWIAHAGYSLALT